MKKHLIAGLLSLFAFNATAGLELTDTYHDWEHYESKSFDTGEAVILGVSSVKSDGNVDTVALRCTTEGVNLLFFNGLLREELGYPAKAVLDDDADPFHGSVPHSKQDRTIGQGKTSLHSPNGRKISILRSRMARPIGRRRLCAESQGRGCARPALEGQKQESFALRGRLVY